MNKIVKSTIFVFAFLGLVGCSAFDFFIERAINGFEERSANRIKRFAEFDASQEEKIDQLAAAIDDWMRTERLAKVSDALLTIADEIELDGEIPQAFWRETYYELEQGLLLSRASHIVDGFTELAMTLTDDQVQEVLISLDEFHERRKNDDDGTIEEQNREAINNTNWLFRASGRSLKRAEKNEAVRIIGLAKRDREAQLAQNRSRIDALQKLITERNKPSVDFRAQLQSLWIEAEQPDYMTEPETAEYNFMVSYDCITYLLSVLDQENQKDMAKVLRDYAALFAQLAES